MSYIIKNPVGKHTYLYECEGYREDGKVMGHRKTVGKIDPVTGAPVYKQEYIQRMTAAGLQVEGIQSQPLFSIDDVKNSSVLEFGLVHLLKKLALDSGLLSALESAMPKFASQVYSLASHLVASGDPFIYCEEWLRSVDIADDVGPMSSQRISELLRNVTFGMREKFYYEWAGKRSESEYLALDITSVSSYSELIEDVEWGYNRDGDELPQINLCLLTGETSKLPIYQTTYSGSLNDVSTLTTTLSKFDHIINGKPILTVMDKGFFSKKNVDNLLSTDKKFVIAVPFSSAFARTQVAGQRDVDSIKNGLFIGGDSLRAVTKKRAWGSGHTVYAHIFYNPVRAVNSREKIVSKVIQMRDTALSEPEKYINDDDYCKYLEFTKRRTGGFSVEIREDAIENACKHLGWLVIISNHIAEARDALRIYRTKDVVEKSFLKLKNSIDLGRLRVHGDDAMQTKIFIGFVALVLLSQIHNVMFDHDLYKRWTMKQLLRILSKQRVQVIKGSRIILPPTKEQRDIFTAFGIADCLLL